MYNKKELKALWAQYDFKPLKRLGQNFLIDKNIKEKIISSLNLKKSDFVLEIGAGFGELTLGLAENAGEVFAVEKDKKIFEILDRELGRVPNLTLLNSDFLRVDIAELCKGNRVIMVGNLPYYITTPILEKFILERNLIKGIFITVQKEVAGRILAKAGTGEYSSLSVFIQFYTSPRPLFDIKAACFFPEPEVDSRFLELRVLPKPSVTVKNEEVFFKVVRKAFHQKRKTILNSLSHKAALGMDKKSIEGVLLKLGIPPDTRPQRITLEDFARLADAIL